METWSYPDFLSDHTLDSAFVRFFHHVEETSVNFEAFLELFDQNQ